MNTDAVGIIALVATNILLVGGAWGDMRRQIQSNRERQDERHTENQAMLHEIRDDVQRINGTVARHDALLTQPRTKSRTRR